MIKDMYNGVVTSVRAIEVEINAFPITIGLYQGFALNTYLFAFVINNLYSTLMCGFVVYFICK